VKNAIKELYGTAPLSVNISQQRPLKKYRWGREVGQTKRVKKAIVTMPKGTVLNLTE
jgi:ribosomal protein L23